LGNSQNQLHYSVREPPTPVTMETGLGFLVIPRNRHSAAHRFSTPLELFPDDRINFMLASGNPNVTSAVVSLLIQLDI